jgi:hypothetical protein
MTLFLGLVTASQSFGQNIIPPSSQGEYTLDYKFGDASTWPTRDVCVVVDKYQNCKQSKKAYNPQRQDFVFFEKYVEEVDAPKYFDQPVHLSLNFVGLSQDASLLKTEFRVYSPLLPNVLFDRRSTYVVRQNWKLTKCDGEDIRSDYGAPTDFKQAIAQLRATEFKEYMNCDLIPVGPPICQIERDGCENSIVSAYDHHMTFHFTGDITVPINSKDYVLHPQHPPDANKEALVSAGTQKFVKILKDYGNLLVSLNGTTSDAHELALQAYINQHRGEISSALASVEQNLSGTSSITKLMVTTSINQTYSYVHLIEGQINNKYLLDEIVQGPL